MIRRIALVVVLLMSCLSLAEKKTEAGPLPSAAELAAITARGRLLEAYDVATWHATDAVEGLRPDKSVAPLYVARKTENGWEVVFGRLNERQDAFLIVYQASPGTTPTEFTVKRADPPVEDHSFYLAAAKAIQTAARDFGKPGRAYNSYVFPTENAQLYVYLLPAQTVNGIYPLGGDVRYTIAADGGSIVERRQMHKTILELNIGQNLAASYHTHILSNIPEDSDVFHVLTRKPSIPEIVGGADKHVYEIQTDGSIKRIK
jgi:hypothetical protein